MNDPTSQNYLQEYVYQYLDNLLFEKGLSQNTLDAYQKEILDFVKFWQETCPNQQANPSINPLKLELKLVQSYFIKRSNHLKNSSIIRRKSALRQFFLFLKRKKIIQIDFLDYFKNQKTDDFIPETITLDEVKKLLKVAIDKRPNVLNSWDAPPQNFSTYRYSFRNELVVLLFYSLGIRVSELCNLKINDFQFDQGLVMIKGKGEKVRFVPLFSAISNKVKKYQKHVRPAFTTSNKLTKINAHNLITNKNGGAFSRISMWKLVKQLAEKAGIKKTISPHTFRHSFATHMVQSGADIRIVQELLGHANIQTTERYTHLMMTDLEETLAQYHPRYSAN